MTYYYVVNTFYRSEPIQADGFVTATSEKDAIQKLISDGIVHDRVYEFLELKEVDDVRYYANDNTCVCCGNVIPEGRMVCPRCERG